MDEEIKREIIMEHYQNPLNRKRSDDDKEYEKINTANQSCIDNLDIYVKFNGDKIEDITFDGEACAISISSTSIMIENLIGKSAKEALAIINNFESMINEKEYDGDILKNALVYADIYKQSSRKSCAYLPYRGIKEILEKKINN